MLMCVKTVSYSVLINGEPKGKITPTRGLRQGDPISPYLFLLCAEDLTAMLNREEGEGQISGVSVCRGAPRISHFCLPMTTSFLERRVLMNVIEC